MIFFTRARSLSAKDPLMWGGEAVVGPSPKMADAFRVLQTPTQQLTQFAVGGGADLWVRYSAFTDTLYIASKVTHVTSVGNGPVWDHDYGDCDS